MHIAYNANTKSIIMEKIEMTKCREGLEDFGVCYKNGIIFYTFQTFLFVHVLIIVANGKLFNV
jgi:hypothetical protein